ncbi:MAG: hypothetical protein ACTH5B_20440 [Marinomonas sp.]|uniref:hypothetical protein n=1 Tax=Marinomonas sp. TaxID=1904862 RepID=UPI003F9D7BCE
MSQNTAKIKAAYSMLSQSAAFFKHCSLLVFVRLTHISPAFRVGLDGDKVRIDQEINEKSVHSAYIVINLDLKSSVKSILQTSMFNDKEIL